MTRVIVTPREGGNPTRVVEVDGIPVLLASTTGPLRAGLVFRVGRADESLATAGITHLVEHLALHRHGGADGGSAIGVTTTGFVVRGTSEDIVGFLNGVCASLRALPIDRLPTEKKIIEAEAAEAPTVLSHEMMRRRHGARDFGLVGYPEYGVHSVTADEVMAWATTRFNRGNAALWLAADEIPAGLCLVLPDGARWPLPAESSTLPVTPAHFSVEYPGITMDARVPRNEAALAYATVLERRLHHELGPSHNTSAHYLTDGRPLATIAAFVDAGPGRPDSTLDRFLTLIRRLRDAGVDAEETAAVRAHEIANLRDADIEVHLLAQRTTDLLSGFPVRTTQQLIAELAAMTAEDIHEIAHMADRSALLMVPDSIARPPAGYVAAPTWSRVSVAGQRYWSRSDYRTALVHGADGVSLTGPHGVETVLFGECAAVLRFADGARHLIGADGIGVHVEPSLFPIPLTALHAIDDSVSPAAIADLPPRDPASIPKPERMTMLGTPVGLTVVLLLLVAGVPTAMAATDGPGLGCLLAVALAGIIAGVGVLVRR
jgi:zinc protease